MFYNLASKTDTIQGEYELFKTGMLKMYKICGIRKPRKGCQKTVWWNKEIHKTIQYNLKKS